MSELLALLLADARLPTGGHTQSAGLEPAVNAGLSVPEVLGYARDRQRTVVLVDAGTAVVARSATDPLAVEAHWAARTPSQALRAASRRQGRGLLRLAARVWPGVVEVLPADAEIARPVVLGVVAAATGLSATQVARLVAYDDAQSVVAASLKLLPIDPADTVGWLVDLAPDIEAAVAATAWLTDPRDVPADGSPHIDQLAQQHSIERMRLFHA